METIAIRLIHQVCADKKYCGDLETDKGCIHLSKDGSEWPCTLFGENLEEDDDSNLLKCVPCLNACNSKEYIMD